MESNKLLICGTARLILPEELSGAEVWSVGRTSLLCADRYYELHGLACREPRYDYRRIPVSQIRQLGLPMVNSVCVMLAHAIVENRHTHIHLVATPLRAGGERVDQRPAVAFLVGYAKAQGFQVFWEDGPDFTTTYMGDMGADTTDG